MSGDSRNISKHTQIQKRTSEYQSKYIPTEKYLEIKTKIDGLDRACICNRDIVSKRNECEECKEYYYQTETIRNGYIEGWSFNDRRSEKTKKVYGWYGRNSFTYTRKHSSFVQYEIFERDGEEWIRETTRPYQKKGTRNYGKRIAAKNKERRAFENKGKQKEKLWC